MISRRVDAAPAEFRKKKMCSPTTVTMVRCHSRMLWALTVMRCIRKNLCGWSAVMVQENTS